MLEGTQILGAKMEQLSWTYWKFLESSCHIERLLSHQDLLSSSAPDGSRGAVVALLNFSMEA
jgi:hypothetical protein